MTEREIKRKKVCFVCLANLCRSPIAEAVFKDIVNRKGVADKWYVDSAGTSNYQIGQLPDERSRSLLERSGIFDYIINHRARQVTKDDYNKFDYLLGMDSPIVKDLRKNAPQNSKAKIALLGYFHDRSPNAIIFDPRYGSMSDFEHVLSQVRICCENFFVKHNNLKRRDNHIANRPGTAGRIRRTERR